MEVEVPQGKAGQKSRHSLGHTEAFHSRANGSAASVHTRESALTGRDSAHGERFLFSPRGNLKYGDLQLLGMWARSCTNLKSRRGHGIILW